MFLRRFFCLTTAGLALALSLTPAFPCRANAGAALPQPPAFTHQTFTLQDLGPLPFVADEVLPGLSDTGKVSLWQDQAQAVQGPAQAVQGAVWSQGQTQRLGGAAGYASQMTHGINVRGEVAGWTSTSANSVDSRAVTRACLWRGTVLTLLGTLGGRNSQAFGISSQSVVVGAAQCADGARHAFLAKNALTKNASLHDLGTLPGGTFSQAYAINTAGQAVGVSNSTLPYKHAVCWRGGQVYDLGLLPGGATSSAQAINTGGQIAGYADTPDGTHAFLYAQGKMQDLGTLGESPSSAAALNDRGQIVGTSGFAPDQDHAFLWQKGVMSDLNKLIAPNAPWVLLRACAINSQGQIVCIGHRKNDQSARLLLLTPILAHAK